MRGSWLALGVCLCGVWGCAAAPRTPSPPAPLPIVYAETPPVVDGKADDAVWGKAAVLTARCAVGRAGQGEDAATARLAWDARCLYGVIAIKDKDVHYLHTTNTQPLWLADCAGVFVKPREDRLAFLEVETNPFGAVMAVAWPSRGMGSKQRLACGETAAGIAVATTVLGTVNDWRDVDEGWVVEFAIPWACCREVFPQAPEPGDVWRVNVCGFDFSAYREQELLFSVAEGLQGRFSEYEKFPLMVLRGR